MSQEAVQERPYTDIYYDYNPFNTDKQERYVQADQKLQGPRDFSTIPQGYYDLLWDGIRNYRYLRESMINCRFLQDNMEARTQYIYNNPPLPYFYSPLLIYFFYDILYI